MAANDDYAVRAAKRTQKIGESNTRAPFRSTQSYSLRSPPDPETKKFIAERRRSAAREYKPPQGPRPPEFTSRREVKASPDRSFLSSISSDPFLGLSARRTASNYSLQSTPPSTANNDTSPSMPSITANNSSDRIFRRNENHALATGQKPPLERVKAQYSPAVHSPADVALKASQIAVTVPPPPAPLSTRAKRQSQFIVPSVPKIPNRTMRQSIGPGAMPNRPPQTDAEAGSEVPQYTRPTLASQAKPKPKLALFPMPGDAVGDSSASERRVVRTKSVQARPDVPAASQRRSTSRDRSRAEGSRQRQSSVSAKRKSQIGLARAVSPTDVKKAQRTSAVIKEPVPHLPTPEPIPSRSRLASPSHSSRTTPENNVRFSLGRSVSSRSSYCSVRPPSAGLSTPSQGRPRSKADKPESLEIVPPVPAIPKGFGSPNDTRDETFDAYETADAFASRQDDPSRPVERQSRHVDTALDNKARRRLTLGSRDGGQSNRQSSYARLPPLSLGPLSMDTLQKIDQLPKEESRLTPPTANRPYRPPVTPMTTSRVPQRAPHLANGDKDVFDSREEAASPTVFFTPNKSNERSHDEPSPVFNTPKPSQKEIEKPKHSRFHLSRSRNASRNVEGPDGEPDFADIKTTPSRRKLSLSFRRSTSKNEINADAAKMPPPKLPVPRTKTEPSLPALFDNGTRTIPSRGSSAQSSQRTELPRLAERPPLRFISMPSRDANDQAAEDEMRRLASRKTEFEAAARKVDDLAKGAKPRSRISPGEATRHHGLNIYERGEIIDFPDIYFCGRSHVKKHVGDLSSGNANFGFDDERGDYNIVNGDHLAYRYEVVDLLGKGSFGQVVRCIDHKDGKLVAVKIIRNKKRFHQQALVEVDILQRLRGWDPKDEHCMVNFTQSFYFRGHLCIATELLGMNLYEFIKAHDFRGFSLKLIRCFTKQMLGCLCLLQQQKVIHCDLKPENILLAHPLHSSIKTIDFGSSCFETEKVYTYIQSRFYRSPEVILGMDYGMPIDIWSMGCILAELYTGYPIFPGENEQEQLACIMEIFGPPEKHLIDKCLRKRVFFDSLGKPRVTVSSKGKRRRPSSRTLQQSIKCDDGAFLDFLAKCLRWDPDRRIKPDEAMQHEFIAGLKVSLNQSPTRRPFSLRTPSGRPLPEPPSAIKRINTGPRVPSSSPVKGGIPQRRQSTVLTGAAASGVKRGLAQNGAPLMMQRTSGRTDFASAAAAASLRQR